VAKLKAIAGRFDTAGTEKRGRKMMRKRGKLMQAYPKTKKGEGVRAEQRTKRRPVKGSGKEGKTAGEHGGEWG